MIASDGEIIEGAATVDESAITGESAPVIREAGGDRSSVTGGTRVLSDVIKIRISADPGHSFLDRMIGLVEGAKRQKTPNEIALTILLSALTVIFLVVCVTLMPFGIYSQVAFSITVLVALLVCLIPDDDRRAAQRHRHRGHRSPRAEERPGHERPRGGSGRRRRCAAAGQDRHDHAGQSPGGRVFPAPGVEMKDMLDAAQLSSLADETPEGRSIVVLAKEKGVRGRSLQDLPHATFVPFTAQTRMSGVDLGNRSNIAKARRNR
jgi:K+-transporting ATPase ATPase B chain